MSARCRHSFVPGDIGCRHCGLHVANAFEIEKSFLEYAIQGLKGVVSTGQVACAAVTLDGLEKLRGQR